MVICLTKCRYYKGISTFQRHLRQSAQRVSSGLAPSHRYTSSRRKLWYGRVNRVGAFVLHMGHALCIPTDMKGNGSPPPQLSKVVDVLPFQLMCRS